MEYGESSFDILYLGFALFFGVFLIIKHKNKVALLFGIMTLLLGAGDAFHLIPRVCSYFIGDNLIFWKGIGKLITSITMTIFYILLELSRMKLKNDQRMWPLITLFVLSVVRIILCAFPQNDWFVSPSNYMWGIYRNIPFVLMGILTIYLWFVDLRKVKPFRFIWLLTALSFAFYLITVLGANYVPMLGMMMLPKTICYVLMIIAFYQYNRIEE